VKLYLTKKEAKKLYKVLEKVAYSGITLAEEKIMLLYLRRKIEKVWKKKTK